MEARKDTDVNTKVNQRGLVPVSSPRRAERAPGSEPTATRGRNLERAPGSAAELSHSGGVSTDCGVLRDGRDPGEGGRFTGCSLARQGALKLSESLEASGRGWEPWQAGSGAEHVGLDAGWLHVGGNSTGEEGECSTPGAGGIEEGWGLQS